MRRLHCVTPWTVRDQILEISATRLHILRLQTGLLLILCHEDVIDCMPLENCSFTLKILLCWAFPLLVLRTLLTLVCVVFVTSGLVHVGDELREVNGNLVTHKRPDEISQILVKKKNMHHISWDTVGLFPEDQCGWWCYSVFDQSQSQGSITLKIIPAVAEEDKLKESRVRLLCLQHPSILRGYHINWKQRLPEETGS